MFASRRYQVTGIQPVLDHQPGEVFEADIDPVQEQRLVASGALRRIEMPDPVYPPPLDVEPPPTTDPHEDGVLPQEEAVDG